MEHHVFGTYEILVLGKEDGSVHDPQHSFHQHMCTLKQCHGTNIYTPQTLTPWPVEIQADASIATLHDDYGIAVYTADCLPIVLMHAEAVAVVHVSWKTLYDWIIQKVVKKLCRQSSGNVDMTVYIWPSIRRASYEVSEEFLEYFPGYCSSLEDGRLVCDLLAIACDQLIHLGVIQNNIHTHSDCTYAVPEKRYSYRRGDIWCRNAVGVRLLAMSSDN